MVRISCMWDNGHLGLRDMMDMIGCSKEIRRSSFLCKCRLILFTSFGVGDDENMPNRSLHYLHDKGY